MSKQDYRELIICMLGKIRDERTMRLIYRFTQSLYINGEDVKEEEIHS